MRLLLDNCIPRKFVAHLAGHSVTRVVDLGWDTLPDGRLLDAMGDRFEALVTVDKSLPFQQRLDGRAFAVVVLRARTNRLIDLARLAPALLDKLAHLQAGKAYEISE